MKGFECPNCGLAQAGDSKECAKCQIIFEKWYAKEARRELDPSTGGTSGNSAELSGGFLGSTAAGGTSRGSAGATPDGADAAFKSGANILSEVPVGKLFLLILLVALYAIQGRSPRPPEGTRTSTPIDVTQEPLKTAPSAHPFTIPGFERRETFTIVPHANLDISAEVLSAHHYDDYDDRWKSAPVDLCLAWGEVPEQLARQPITVTQHDRLCDPFKGFGPPGQEDPSASYFLAHFDNFHLLPATKNLGKALATVHNGDHVRLRGYLIDQEEEINGQKGWTQTTNLLLNARQRSPGAGGECAIMWVTELQHGSMDYR